MCDMTHSYVSHDSFICVTWLIHTCDMTHSYRAKQLVLKGVGPCSVNRSRRRLHLKYLDFHFHVGTIFVSTLSSDGDSRSPECKLVWICRDSLGTPVRTCLKVTGTPVKTCVRPPWSVRSFQLHGRPWRPSTSWMRLWTPLPRFFQQGWLAQPSPTTLSPFDPNSYSL